MPPHLAHRAPKKATNLSLNSELLRQARELEINLSSVLEQALAQEVSRRLGEQWLEENREAIAEYNERVATQGLWNDDVRRF